MSLTDRIKSGQSSALRRELNELVRQIAARQKELEDMQSRRESLLDSVSRRHLGNRGIDRMSAAMDSTPAW